MTRLVIVAALYLVVLPSVAHASDRDLFPGLWQLLEFKKQDPTTGEKTNIYGIKPQGILVYTSTGHMSAQIVDTERQPFFSGSLSEASLEELRATVSSYSGYFGKFTVDQDAKTVTHQVTVSSISRYVGKDLVRSYEFVGDKLLLKFVTPRGNLSVLWQRVQ